MLQYFSSLLLMNVAKKHGANVAARIFPWIRFAKIYLIFECCKQCLLILQILFSYVTYATFLCYGGAVFLLFAIDECCKKHSANVVAEIFSSIWLQRCI